LIWKSYSDCKRCHSGLDPESIKVCTEPYSCQELLSLRIMIRSANMYVKAIHPDTASAIINEMIIQPFIDPGSSPG
jgi:hypothetical protein